MHIQILEKLNKLIHTGCQSEADALYFMAQIRKSLEHEIISLNDDGAIKFYCDWVLHSHLKGTYAQRILKVLSPIHDFYLTHPIEEEIPNDLHIIIRPIINLDEFRSSLQDYLVAAKLDEKIVCDVQEWHRFLQLYLRIIEDCPIKVRGDNHNLPVKEIILNLSHNLPKARIPKGEKYSFSLRWTFVGTDGVYGGINNHLSIPNEFLAA